MFSSAELIEALRRRMRRSLRPERPAGEFPPGWRAWFASMQEKAGAVTGATADAVLAIFMAREPLPPPAAVVALNRWQAFATLWRQEWHPASQDERSVRIFATVLSFILHIFFVVALIWLMYARFMGVAPEEARRGENVVQVEFIGEGTPEEEGGGPPQGQTEIPETASTQAPPAPQPPDAAQPPSPAIPEPAVASEEPPQPQPPAPPVAQPLQVTETPAPDTMFTLPPPRPVEVQTPRMVVPEVAARTREIEVVEVPQIRPEQRLPQREIAAPDLRRPPTELIVREIPAPLPQVRTPSIAPPRIAAPELTRQAPSVTSRAIPMPATQPSTTAGTAGQSADGASRASDAPAPGGTSTARSGTRPSSPGTGSGTAATPRPGALPTPRRGDDWGDSTRDRPGGQAGQPGLFNPDGSPRLAGDGGRVGGGLPPGTITEDYEKIDRMGTWLKRPSSDYEPTAFDRFWVPHENLLQEWVRRSIKEVLIPIPGTSKSIKCSVVLLALGGACGITDPNMQDIEASAREAPDVPFKPELQEDQDSLGDPAPTP